MQFLVQYPFKIRGALKKVSGKNKSEKLLRKRNFTKIKIKISLKLKLKFHKNSEN